MNLYDCNKTKKHFAEEKKVLVCLEVSMRCLQAHKNFFWLNVLLIFLTDHGKYFFCYHLEIFYTAICTLMFSKKNTACELYS